MSSSSASASTSTTTIDNEMLQQFIGKVLSDFAGAGSCVLAYFMQGTPNRVSQSKMILAASTYLCLPGESVFSLI